MYICVDVDVDVDMGNGHRHGHAFIINRDNKLYISAFIKCYMFVVRIHHVRDLIYVRYQDCCVESKSLAKSTTTTHMLTRSVCTPKNMMLSN